MARNRMIRPELWSNEQFVELSPTARLLYIGLWNFCDDGGNHPASPKSAKMEIFPGDDLTAAAISDLIDEIKKQKLITQYEAENTQYWHITDWQNLQKIEKKTFTHPQFAEQSASSRRAVGENPQVKEEKEEEKRREAREHAPAHEDEISNQKTATPTPHPEPFTAAHHAIREWARPDDFKALRDIADEIRYDPTIHGPVADEVLKFTAYYLDPRRHPDDRTAFQADPVHFFQQRIRKWLLDAKNLNRQPKTTAKKTQYEPPPHQRQRTNATETAHIGSLTGKIITEIV